MERSSLAVNSAASRTHQRFPDWSRIDDGLGRLLVLTFTQGLPIGQELDDCDGRANPCSRTCKRINDVADA
jgi:hypothetical protein